MPRSDSLLWCLRQKKGIRLVAPNNNLCREYLAKARSSLNMLNAAIERNETDWIIATAYYAKYFALYALLQKCGIKSEIHDYSIETFRLFTEIGLVESSLFVAISSSKELRIEAQYYVTGAIEKSTVEENVKSAREFVLKLEEIIEKITEEQIGSVRKKLKELITVIKEKNE